MSAKKPPRLAGLGRRKKLVVVCLAIVCALIAVGLYAWQSQPVPEAGASVTTAEGKSRHGDDNPGFPLCLRAIRIRQSEG